MTGIDRVEAEYLSALLAHDTPLFGLVRLALGYIVLDPDGVREIARRLDGSHGWGPPDWRARLVRRGPELRRRAESDVRRFGFRRVAKGRLAAKLGACLPAGIAYLNVGHSNISTEVFEAFGAVESARISVFLHDTIPLDWPQYQRPETVPRFREKLRLVAEHADLVICNSRQTRDDATRHMSKAGSVPNLLIAHLGVRVPEPKPRELPAGVDLTVPYFVTLGTIEPRKNHQLLLDIWARLARGATPPTLFIVGQRGWNNATVFNRLDQHPAHVQELAGLSDGAVGALLCKANGLLFPSFAEGYGLPVAEAAALNVPVICSELAVLREIVGEYPIYADPADMYDWETKIRKLAENRKMQNNEAKGQGISLPSWDDHFNLVLRLT